MRADMTARPNAISIALMPGAHAEKADACHPRAIVALSDGEPVELQLLYPDLGFEEPLRTCRARVMALTTGFDRRRAGRTCCAGSRGSARGSTPAF